MLRIVLYFRENSRFSQFEVGKAFFVCLIENENKSDLYDKRQPIFLEAFLKIQSRKEFAYSYENSTIKLDNTCRYYGHERKRIGFKRA